MLSQLPQSAKPEHRGKACAGEDSRGVLATEASLGHCLKLGRVISRLTLGALWLGTECQRESVYSLGQALSVAGASRVCDPLSASGPDAVTA